jgi:hypothetical protein
MTPTEQVVAWLAVTLIAALQEKERLLDELEAACTSLDGIASLVTVGRTPRRPPGSPDAAAP